MTTQALRQSTPEEYLAFERSSDDRHEYLGGEICAMGGVSPEHALIVTNVASELRLRTKGGPCRVYSTDLRLRVSPAGLFTYPDVVVICGPSQFADDQRDTVTNPTLLVEVLSDSTQGYDRGEKFEHYRSLESFREYLLVAQGRPHVERYLRREGDGWILEETNRLEDVVKLDSIGAELPLAEIYDRVDWLSAGD